MNAHNRTASMDFDSVAEPMALPASRNGRYQEPVVAAAVAATARDLPSDHEAESNLIAALFVDAPEVLTKCADAGLTESSFNDPKLAVVFSAAAELNDSKEPVSTVTLAHHLKGHAAFSGQSIVTEMMWLEKQSATTAHVAMLIRSIRGAELLRKAHGAALQSMEEVFNCAAEDAADLLDGQQARLKRIADSSASPSSLMDRVFNPSKLVPRPPPVYTIADIGICTRGNLTTIYAQSKAGKSSFMGAMIAATMVTGTASNDTLGVKGPNYGGQAVLHFDTEQSTYDWQALVLSILRRAGLQSPPKWFLSFSLAGMEAVKAERFVHAALRHATKQFGGIHSLFLDGVADLVSSPNNEDDSNAMVARLHGAAIEHDTAIINILHLNPASKDKTDKGRGHLGSQLERKSESNLTLKKEGDVTVLMAEGRQRGRPIPPDKAPAFQWNEEHGMHRSCTRPGETAPDEKKKGGRQTKYQFSAFKAIFPAADQPAKPLSELYRLSNGNVPMSQGSFYNLLQRFAEEGNVQFADVGARRLYKLAI